MNVDLIRKIDYWMGIPLTFLATGLVKFCGLFSVEPLSSPRKILFIELSEMGSAILADPAMRKARKVFDAELFFCIFSINQNSLYLLNTVDKENVFAIRVNSPWNFVRDTIRFFFWTRKNKIDTVIDLELFSRFTALLTGLSGAVNRVGFFRFHNEGLYRGRMLTHEVAYNPHIHIAKNFIALVNALSARPGEMPMSKTLIADEEIVLTKVRPEAAALERIFGHIRGILRDYDPREHRLILINPNASNLLPQRRWPMEKYRNLMAMILAYDPGARLLVTGASAEKEEISSLTASVKDNRCASFAGKVSLDELPALYSVSTLMVTNDSGPAHFASVTDLPTFVLFGPETPSLYGALGNFTPIYAGLACSPCVSAANHRKTACRDNVCLQVISEQTVFDAIKGLLKQQS